MKNSKGNGFWGGKWALKVRQLKYILIEQPTTVFYIYKFTVFSTRPANYGNVWTIRISSWPLALAIKLMQTVETWECILSNCFDSLAWMPYSMLRSFRRGLPLMTNNYKWGLSFRMKASYLVSIALIRNHFHNNVSWLSYLVTEVFQRRLLKEAAVFDNHF